GGLLTAALLPTEGLLLMIGGQQKALRRSRRPKRRPSVAKRAAVRRPPPSAVRRPVRRKRGHLGFLRVFLASLRLCVRLFFSFPCPSALNSWQPTARPGGGGCTPRTGSSRRRSSCRSAPRPRSRGSPPISSSRPGPGSSSATLTT